MGALLTSAFVPILQHCLSYGNLSENLPGSNGQHLVKQLNISWTVFPNAVTPAHQLAQHQ